MQEEVTQKTMALAITTSRMTASVLAKAMRKFLEAQKNKSHQLPKGKQTLLPFFSGIQHGLYGGNDNSDFPIGQFICQSVKLSAQRSFPICRIPKKKLIHGDMIAGHELKKDLEARMLSLILNIGEIAGRKIHLITYFVTRLLLSCPRRLNC